MFVLSLSLSPPFLHFTVLTFVFILLPLISIGISIMASALVPVGYRITTMTAILPSAVQAACHILYPIVLNPWLMMYVGTTSCPASFFLVLTSPRARFPSFQVQLLGLPAPPPPLSLSLVLLLPLYRSRSLLCFPSFALFSNFHLRFAFHYQLYYFSLSAG